MNKWRLALALSALMCVGHVAYAQDDNQQIIAQQGDWLAGSYSPTPTSAPTVCVAASDGDTVLAFRADDQGTLDIRLQNSNWSLPADASGTIKIVVNGHTYSYPANAMSASMIDGSITQDQLTALVGDMETADQMQVTVGSASPTTIPLDGSQIVLTAFMTCAGIQNPSQNTGGSNPFSSSN